MRTTKIPQALLRNFAVKNSKASSQLSDDNAHRGQSVGNTNPKAVIAENNKVTDSNM